MTLQSIRLVTFDATNTLLRFKVHPWQYYTTVGRDYGFVGTGNDLKPRLLDSYKEMWNKYPNFGKNIISWEDWWGQVIKKTFNGQLPKTADIDCLASKLINDFRTTKCWCLAEGGDDLLNIFKNRGISLGVISNFDPRLIEVLHNVNIYNKFDFVLNSFDIGVAKPDRKIFEYALTILSKDIIPEECIHIGDDVEKDYLAARAAGWNGILISKNTCSENVKMEHIYCSLNDLYKAISENKLRL
ncbi:rhythmically expressed gene 2 protein-like [Battus philenor]|uniref:rhythmically expressed gene 2 protein-like n=1 Tax=Battus philenor TaxID=42288 RepID=UPI0035CE93F8